MSAHEKPPHTTQPTAPDTLSASGAVDEDFTFNDRVAEVFDDMLSRSIPSYRTVIEGTAQLLAARLPDGAMICDLGCSTGTTLLELARLTPGRRFRFIGLDNAPAMLDKARRKTAMFGKTNQVSFRETDITTAFNAQNAIAALDKAISNIDAQRADLGAVQNRFDSTVSNLQSISENSSAARSRIQDADFASETAELTKQQTLQQASTAILSQANQLPSSVLKLLQ